MWWIIFGFLAAAAVSPSWIALRIAGLAAVIGGAGLVFPPRSFAESPRWIDGERVDASAWDAFLSHITTPALIALAFVPFIGVLIAQALRGDKLQGPGSQ